MKRSLISSSVFAAALLILVFGCSRFRQNSSSPPARQPETRRDAEQQQPQPPQQPQEAHREDAPEPNPPADPDRPAESNDASILYGAWINTSPIGGLACRSEMIFERTGTYSGAAVCDNGYGGTLMTRSVGNWRLLQPGMVRLQYTDHEPKEFGGKPVYYPDGETMTFTVRDHNHLDTSAGLLTREL